MHAAGLYPGGQLYLLSGRGVGEGVVQQHGQDLLQALGGRRRRRAAGFSGRARRRRTPRSR